MYDYALKELWRHKARTITNIIGYAIAVASMILIISITRSHFLSAVGVLKSTGTHFIAFIPESHPCCKDQFENGGPCAEGVYTAMIGTNSLKKIKNLPGVRDAAPYLLFKMYNDEHKAFFSIGGTDLTSFATTTNVCAVTNILQGRYLTPNDRDVIVIEESFANVTNLNVNDCINAFGREFKIVGIVNCGIKPAKADLYAPIGVVQEIVKQYGKCLSGDVNMNIVLVEVADARIQEDVMKSVQKVLGRATISSYNCYIPARDVISITERAGWAISLVIIISVILFALKSQLASVVERTREIGILKSVGWSNFNIMGQILMESIIQAVVGGVIGCSIAILVISLFRCSNFSLGGNIILNIHYSSLAIGMALVLIGGILAGIFPAWKAYSLQPAEALRRF